MDKDLYREELTSDRTLALFVALTSLFDLLTIWRASVGRLGALGIVFFCLGVFFLFCAINYRTLVISLTPEALVLRFGIITWVVGLETIEDFRLDELPPLMRYGGAGVHFMMVGGRYRVSFNFLEYPRVVIMLRRRAGLVRDVSFSTRRPDELMRRIWEAKGEQHPA